MQNKRMIIFLSILVIVVGAAAFIGGRMLNQKAGPLGLGMPLGGGGEGMVSVSVQITPAPELPTTDPETRGLFAERKDNSIILATISMEAGGGGIVVERSEGGSVAGSPLDNSGPKVEVVTTGKTAIYIETTEFGGPPASGETVVVQQTVEEGSLDDLTSQSFVTVWGRKSGDRIIAEVLFISNPVMFKRP